MVCRTEPLADLGFLAHTVCFCHEIWLAHTVCFCHEI
jgi:hypothetical protein